MEESEYLFDANAVLDLIQDNRTEDLFDGSTLDLMFYEVTSATWKMAAYRQEITREEGEKLIEHVSDIRPEMRVIPMTELGEAEVYKTAWETSLTGYDSAYVLAAQKNNLTLVTDDGGIHDHAPSDVTVTRDPL